MYKHIRNRKKKYQSMSLSRTSNSFFHFSKMITAFEFWMDQTFRVLTSKWSAYLGYFYSLLALSTFEISSISYNDPSPLPSHFASGVLILS